MRANPDKKRVVITGIGPVAPNGIGREKYWEALKKGVSGVRRITRFDTSGYPFKLAGEIPDLDPTKYLEKKFVRRTDRATHLAAVATMLALEDAKLELGEQNTDEIDLIVGTALAGTEKYGANLLEFVSSNKKRMNPFAAVNSYGDACSGRLASLFNIRGYVATVNMACAAGLQAIIEAHRRILYDETKLAIACGTDAPLLEEVVFAFSTATALSTRLFKTPAPFDKNRDGLLLGEGAGALILEEYQHALNRKAPIYGEIMGYGNSADAASVALGDDTGSGKVLAIRNALESAQVSSGEVDYVNAHGPGTKKGDVAEAVALKTIFGERSRTIPISSTKSMLGHTQGACGALETIATLLSFKEGIIHPTINFEAKDEKCDINCVPNVAIRKQRVVWRQI